MDHVLVLNASFEPLVIVSWQKAIHLLFQGKVEVLEEYDREIRTISKNYRLPAVLRLIKFIPIARKKNVIKFSRSFKTFFIPIVIAIAGLISLVKYVYGRPKGRLMFDTFMLKLPVFGSLLRKVAVARFTRTLATMITSGVPILDALEICSISDVIIDE